MQKPATGRTRTYRSQVRSEQAAATRRRILDAARDLFLQHGYASTSVAAVARAAGVATDTVYSTFRSKIAVLKALLDEGVGGDELDVPLLDRPGPQAVRRQTDQRAQLAAFAVDIGSQWERFGPLDDMLRGAAAVDADAAALRSDMQQRQRRAAMRSVAAWIAANGPLRVSEADAADLLWTLTSPEVHRLLVVDCGWSRERYQGWLSDTLQAGLLPRTG